MHGQQNIKRKKLYIFRTVSLSIRGTVRNM